ncbi:von Willebrand factor [Bombina bombina]|uniref:von Willebrand factor n=2 Tax=Bombina bombina TaxID=8345 RepID=UPI00235AF45D|nr:von Willebrand factor [Bombina bombina]
MFSIQMYKMKCLKLFAVLVIYNLTAGLNLGVEGKLDWPSLSRCSLFGENHIRTFDGTFYGFQGDCSYMLAGDCLKHSFSLLVDYHNGKKKSVSMYLGEYFDIHMFMDGTTTQGEKSISMPYASNGIFLEMEAGYYKMSSHEHGFVVKMDVSGNIQLALSNKLFNQTCGLCGNFNQFPDDDFMTQEGILADRSYDFANSWALHGANKRCRRILPSSSTCNISSDSAEKGIMQRCQMLKTSSVFIKCHHVVDPDPFIAICEDDMCSCAEEMNCHCQTFLEYARTCAHNGVTVDRWGIHSSCEPQCPLGMEYNECVYPCAKTCQSLNINEVCPEQCIDGCSCPAAKVLDGDRCVETSQCSCIHSGKRYPVASTITRDCNSCICRHGMWVCSNEECPGECSVSGQSHFKSFDNKHFTFSGICHYLLARDTMDNSFSVAIETVQCADDPDAVCTRSASVRLQEMQNMTIKLKHGGGVSLEGQDIRLPLNHGSLRIQNTVLSSVRLTYKEDLQIDWDGHGELLIKLSPVYSGSTSGLCGNYNGNQGDDFLSPSGLVETNVEVFGNLWKLNSDCTDLTKQDTDPCNLNPKRARFAEEVCFALLASTFQSCHNEVNPAPYLKNCRYDVCSCSDGKECLCSAFSTYATACSRKGVLIDWRTPEFCPIKCSEGKIYRQCGSPCNQTCRSLSLPDTDCKEFCMEGCYCPPGLYTNEYGECVPKAECSCHYDGEVFQPDDVFSNHHTMCYCENGLMHCSSNEIPGAYIADAYFNQPPARVKRSLTCRAPLNKFICPENDPSAKGIECAKTCQNYELECVRHGGCTSGCMCPSGRVRHNSKCIVLEKCPCFHNGNEYSPGSSVEIDCNTCICKNRKWQCTNNICDGTCSVIGLSHYMTFDGLNYKFPGDCQYVLVQDYCNEAHGTFRILVRNEGCGFTGEKCSKRITILFRNGEIELANEQVTFKKPPRDETDMEVIQSGRYFILLLGKQMSVTWDKGMRVYVKLKETYRDQVCGLCGNFDGIENNDLTSSNNQVEIDPSDFGNSWRVNPLCADAAKFSASLTGSLCQDNVMKQIAVENACNILIEEMFAECAKLVNPEPYWEICRYETCACESIGDCVCFCDSIAAYSHVCAQKGVNIQWRSSRLCPQSCEEKNKKELEYVCEWRYNSCAPACPTTCQHPESVDCPLKCVEGCHANCPPGKILDEVSESCVDPKDCPVCIIEGRHIPHGKTITLNKDDPHRCQLCHCEGQNLQCNKCKVEHLTTQATTILPEEITPTPEPEVIDESTFFCSKILDLLFLIDGSSKLSENDFEVVKNFIVGFLEKIYISEKRIRVSVLQYHTAIQTIFWLQDNKKPAQLIKMIKGIKYTGSDTALTFEGLKYAAYYIFKIPRENAARIAILLTASSSPQSISNIMSVVTKRKITVIPVGIGPYVNMDDIKNIQSRSPMNKPFILGNVYELFDKRDEIIHYLCDLVPQPPKPLPTKKTNVPEIKVTVSPLDKEPIATVPSLLTTSIATRSPWSKQADIIFVLEGSKYVGEENFNKSLEFLIDTVNKMDISEETIHITIIQYSYTITLEYTFSERQSKQEIIKRIREIKYSGGNSTNTGKALNYLNEYSFTKDAGSRDQVPHLVYMVTSNPSSDVITKISTDINLFPIAVGPNVNLEELEFINPHVKPIHIDSYDDLISNMPELVLEKCCSDNNVPATAAVIIATRTPLIIEEPCRKPMDIIFILDGSANVRPSQFEEMKTFVKSFIKKAAIGPESTQVAVLQYGRTNNMEVAWTDPQDKTSLINTVNNIQQTEDGPSKIGEALLFAVQSAMSEVHGGRPDAAKIAVMVITDKSLDHVDIAAQTATINRVTVFPIGVGSRYDEEELRMLAGPMPNNRVMKLQLIEDLPTMVTLNNEFINKLCTEIVNICIDDNGNQKRPGDKWTLSDKCHSVTCLSDGKTILESHKINCEKIPKPTCHNNFAAIKIEETCGCRWACPCMCMGSSTRHIVTFDGLDFKLIGNCSYVLFHDKEQNIEVILQNDKCASAVHQTCMKSIDIKHDQDSVQISENMEQVLVNGKVTSVPYSSSAFEVSVYGATMYEIQIPSLGFIFTFTPSINEFSLQLNPKFFASKTSGLCGVCDQNTLNDFMLKDGSITADSNTFVKEWTVVDSLGRTCETKLDDVCTQAASSQCNILLSSTFEECHNKIPPGKYFAVCEEASCHGEDICEAISVYSQICRFNGVCVNWRTSDFCPMKCESPMVYNHCRIGCIRDCGNALNRTVCSTYPTEGCFCSYEDVMYNGKCVSENVCTQCTDEYGEDHQYLESWIPLNEPCKICQCVEDKKISCIVKPCPTAQPLTCGPCEVPRIKKTSNQCCQEYECACDLSTCDVNPVPHCKHGLVPILTNPGQCKPNYECACKKEECTSGEIPFCPPYKKLTIRKTECCDEYECTCSCSNSTVICSAGYISSVITNECGCRNINCEPDKVCVFKNNVYAVGSTWEDGCKNCSCTDMVDAVTKLHIVECLQRKCQKDCSQGYTYVQKKDECCGKCKKTVCEQKIISRGQADVDISGTIRYRNVGDIWPSPYDPCVINECAQVNDEVFVLQKNVSCPVIHTKKCPPGFELTCMSGSECCPLCQCDPIPGCIRNGTIIAPGETLMIDACSTCECNVQRIPVVNFKLTCRKTTCQPCPKNTILKKISGSCCGRCVSIGCSVTLRNGTIINVKPNEIVKDGCDTHSCKINERGDLTLERRTTNCPNFNREKCLAAAGKVQQLDNSCCETCVEAECKQVTATVQYVRVDDCMSENQLKLKYCEGKCTSKSVYVIDTHTMEDQCICCSATQTESLKVPLRCANGTLVEHELLQATACECLSHKCKK